MRCINRSLTLLQQTSHLLLPRLYLHSCLISSKTDQVDTLTASVTSAVDWVIRYGAFYGHSSLRALSGGWIGVLMILAEPLENGSDLTTVSISFGSRGSGYEIDAGII
jgi:hypothetical protein